MRTDAKRLIQQLTVDVQQKGAILITTDQEDTEAYKVECAVQGLPVNE